MLARTNPAGAPLRASHRARTSFLVLALTVCALPAAAQDYYVAPAPAGSDANSCLSSGSACATIGHAVSLASDGETISVLKGTYAESVVVDKEVTIMGAESGTPASGRSAGSTSESILDVGGLAVGFDIQADNVTIDGFDIAGDEFTWAGVKMFGTRDGVTVSNNIIRGMGARNPNSAFYSYSYGVWALGDGSSAYRGEITDLIITGNAIRDLGGEVITGGKSGGAGLFLASLSGATVGSGAFIENNAFSDMASGSYLGITQPGIGVVLLEDDHPGRVDSGALVQSNTYTDLVVGVAMQTEVSRVAELNGAFTGVGAYVAQVDGRGTVSEGPLAPFNDRDDLAQVVIGGPTFSHTYYPINQTRYVGLGGTDDCFCTDPLAPCATIQGAVDLSFDGDTIVVYPGVYAETVVIDKRITVNGAGAGTAVGSRVSGSAFESVLVASGFDVGFDIRADGVTIDGFDIEGDGTTWAGIKSFAGLDGVTIQNNFIHGMDAKNPNSDSFAFSYGVWILGGGSDNARDDVTDLTIIDNHIFDLGGVSIGGGEVSGGAGVFVMSATGSTPGSGVTVTGNLLENLADAVHALYGPQPAVGVAVLQDDGPKADGGALVTGNNYVNVHVGVAVELDDSIVSEANGSFTGVDVYAINAGGLATIDEPVLVPFASSTSTRLGVITSPAGTVAYFPRGQEAFDDSNSPAVVTLHGNLSGAGGSTTYTEVTLESGEMVIRQAGVEIYRGAPGSVSQIVIQGTEVSDVLLVDLDLYGLLPTGGIVFHGGGGAGVDSFELVGGGSLTTIEHLFASETDGTVEIDGDVVFTYTGLESVLDELVAANRIFTFLAGSEIASFTDDGAANGLSSVDSNGSVAVAFRIPGTSFVVNLGPGSDTITVDQLDPALAVKVNIYGGDGADRFNITPGVGYEVNILGGDPTVAPGDVLNMELTGTFGADLDNIGGTGYWTFSNRAKVFFTQIETLLDLPGQANLTLTKSPQTSDAYPGDLAIFTLTVTNNGLAGASGVEVTDDLPAAMTCVCGEVASEGSFSYSGGAGGTITWSGIGLAYGESATLTYSATVATNATGSAVNTATITAASPSDPDLTDNTATATITFKRPIRFPAKAVVQALAFYENSLGEIETMAGTHAMGFYRRIPSSFGDRWAPVPSLLPNLYVNDILVAASGVTYLGAHSNGALFQSIDGGRSWEAVDFGDLGRERIHIVNTLAESTVDDIIYVSADDGQVWRFISGVYWDLAGRLPYGASHTPWSLAADPTISGRVFAGTFGDGVWRSDDHGENWKKVSGGMLPHDGSIHVFDLQFDPEIDGTLWAGTSLGIFFSQDGGETWVEASTGLGKFKEVRSIAFGPVDPSPTATGKMYVATWGGGVFEMPGDRNTLPAWEEVALRNQQIGVIGVSPDGGRLFAAPASGGTFTVTLTAVSTNNESESSPELPTATVLDQNYPNPFNPQTTIGFALPESGRVLLTVHDVVGREVAVLADGVLSAGTHEVRFDGRQLPTGAYVYRLRTPTETVDRMMLLVK